MKLRTFTAATMKEAMACVRAELGPDAVIVYAHERRRGGGVEVRAAVEGTPVAVAAPVTKPRTAQPPRAPAVQPAAPPPPPAAELPARKTTPKGLVALAHAAKSAPDVQAAGVDALRRVFLFHGVPERTAQGVLDAAHRLDMSDPLSLLATALDTRFSFNPLPVKARRPVMLVGAPGVGKTVTTAKLAARALLAGHRVQVITTDTVRSGAVDQLEKLVGRMGIKVLTADSPEALAALLPRKTTDNGPVILIDSPGTNVFNASERQDLETFIDPSILEPVLVQAAGTDAGDAADMASQFAQLGSQRLMVTRLDAARRLGGLLAAADGGGLAIAQVSLSPYLSEPLNALSAGALARVLATQAGVSASEPPSVPAAKIVKAKAP